MSTVKRYHPHHPHIDGRDVVLAIDYDEQTRHLESSKSHCRQLALSFANMEAERNALAVELATLRGEVSTELREQIMHLRREVTRLDRSPLPVRQKLAERVTSLLNRWANGCVKPVMPSPQDSATN